MKILSSRSLLLILLSATSALSAPVPKPRDNPLGLPSAPAAELRKLFPYSAPAEKEKRILPIKPKHTTLTEGEFLNGIVVKFKENQKIRLQQNKFVNLSPQTDKATQLEIDEINWLTETVKAKQQRLFNQNSEQELDNSRQTGEDNTFKELPDLNSYFIIELKGLNKLQVEYLVDELNNLNVVEIAYVPSKFSLPVIGKPQDKAPVTGNLTTRQGYLDAAPAGIDARWAWQNRKARGNGIRLTDIEYAWNLDHEDLGFDSTDILNPDEAIYLDQDFRSKATKHGTAVMGELIGANNTYGVTGIANQVDISLWRDNGLINGRTNAIGSVSQNTLRAGDVMLLEMQTTLPGTPPTCATDKNNYPVEVEQAIQDAIIMATSNDRIVVEAAGNGGNNINEQSRFDTDSGAIIVGAGTSTNHDPLCSSNYGTRVDVQGWGQNVTTTGYGDLTKIYKPASASAPPNQEYTSSFSGTSSASPMVAGAIAVINGYFKANISADNANGNTKGTGRYLPPKLMKLLLKNTGTAQGTGRDTGIPTTDALHNIGPLPNIRAALEQGLPVIDVKANNSDRPKAFASNTVITVKATFSTGGLSGAEVEWWAVVVSGANTQYLNSSFNWVTTPSWFSQQGLKTTNMTLFKGALPKGSYTFYVGFDYIKNNQIDFGNPSYIDSVTVTVN